MPRHDEAKIWQVVVVRASDPARRFFLESFASACCVSFWAQGVHVSWNSGFSEKLTDVDLRVGVRVKGTKEQQL